MDVKRVLVTGMSGLIGGIMRDRLQDRFELSALNRRDVPGVRCLQADISDLDAIRPAFDGVDAVLHLAALARGDGSWEEIMANNVIGTYNVFEAARQAGVRRVVFASSGATISGYEAESPYAELAIGPEAALPEPWAMISHTSPVRPSGLYGCSKVWGEVLARHYHDAHGLSILCVRIGAVRPGDQPDEPRQHSVWCSHRDVGEVLERCLVAPVETGYDIVFAVSQNLRNYRDITHLQEVLGYTPQDAAGEA